jgi:hypothetical protein
MPGLLKIKQNTAFKAVPSVAVATIGRDVIDKIKEQNDAAVVQSTCY